METPIYKVLVANCAVQLQMGTCACGTRSLSLRSNPGGSKASQNPLLAGPRLSVDVSFNAKTATKY